MSYKAKFVQDSDCVDYVPSADVAAGDIVIQGDLVGVAKLDISSGTNGAIALDGVYDIGVASGITLSAGAKVYWDATAENATNVASGNTLIGKAVLPVTSGGTMVRVALNK